jgi:transcription-repair coupling factor (superfamily II helicase)
MDGKKLEELMLAFMNGEFDVLVATTIIESGLDVPNANTIFINNANNFGLSDLHQMRGRVGRSNKKAFCYFICPPYSAMTDDARKRIQALEQFSELGSGFNIAMKDLEIRGAGDLLGGEQSGFINEIGFDTYQKIMNEAIEELKENEFKDLYPTENDIETKEYVKDLQIDTDFELLFSDEYINNISERLNLYNELGTIKNEADLQLFQEKLIDRFGPMPPRAVALMNSIRIKWIASSMGIEKLVMKQGKMICYFVSDQQSSFYQSKRFLSVMDFVQKQKDICKIKEKVTPNGLRLLLTFDNVKATRRALELMKMLAGVE